MTTKPSREIVADIIGYCNSHIVPDETYIAAPSGYQSAWFEEYFDFISDHVLGEHLGEAYYQARFLYKIMLALNLKPWKNRGFVKFQIIQYASICEALLQFVIETKFKEEYIRQNVLYEYIPNQNALSKSTAISYEKAPLFLCEKKKRKRDLKRERIDKKISFCREKNVISESSASDFKQLYEARNNIHILKAIKSDYRPRVLEAKSAFILMQKIRDEVKHFIETNP